MKQVASFNIVFGDCQINCLFTRNEFVLMSSTWVLALVDYKLLVFLVLFFQRSNALNKLSVAGLVTF